MERLGIFLYLFAAALVAINLHVLAFVIVGTLLGAKVSEYGLFMGPSIWQISFGNVVFRVNALPLGSFVKFTDEFAQIAAWRRIVITLSGCLLLIAVAMFVFGVNQGWGKFVRGFAHFFWLTLAPFSTGKNLIAALFEFGRNNSFYACLGLLAANLAAFNLLPIGAFNGGQVIGILLKSFAQVPEGFVMQFMTISQLLIMLAVLLWTAAFVSFLFS